MFLQETVKAAASSFYANRSVFDVGRLRFQRFVAETQISNEIGGTDMRTTKFNMKEFGIRLRMLRQACGLTQEEFCDVIGISDTHYRNSKKRIWFQNTIFRSFDPAGSVCCPIHMKQAEKPSHIDKQGNSE